MEKVVIVLSGGQDSTTCLLMAIKKYKKENVEAISFVYKEKYRKDIECAKQICEKFNIKHTIFDAGIIQEIGRSNNVEGRNLVLLSLSAIYAQTNNISNIMIGLAGNSVHPDCSADFVKQLQKTIAKATGANIKILTPLIEKEKVEIWEIADKLGCLEIVEKLTFSCWDNENEHCMKCLSCKARYDGLRKYKEIKYARKN